MSEFIPILQKWKQDFQEDIVCPCHVPARHKTKSNPALTECTFLT